MTTDNRTNEPTEAQVEAAAKAIADCHNPGMFEKYPENWRVEARAALEASNAVVTEEMIAEVPSRDDIIDALVMTDLSDYAGTDMGLIEQAADRVLALFRGGAR